MMDNLEMKVSELATRFFDLRVVVVGLLKPQRTLKRKATDEAVIQDDQEEAVTQDDAKDVADDTTVSGNVASSSTTACGSEGVGTEHNDEHDGSFDWESTMSQPGK